MSGKLGYGSQVKELLRVERSRVTDGHVNILIETIKYLPIASLSA
jgi:hypothetical protein